MIAAFRRLFKQYVFYGPVVHLDQTLAPGESITICYSQNDFEDVRVIHKGTEILCTVEPGYYQWEWKPWTHWIRRLPWTGRRRR
jgi:hypothetical protein